MTENERREIQRQRREAEERIKEFDRRAHMAQSGEIQMPHFAERTNAPVVPKKAEQESNKGFGLLKMLNFGSLKFDDDIAVIILIMLLIGKDGGDELLLLALLYVML